MGNLKSEARLQRHKRTPHRIPCRECDLVFVSMTHLRFHLQYSHDCSCPHCSTFCEGSCSGYYGLATEAAGSEAMEAEEMDKNSIIKDTEITLEKMVKEITVEKLEMAQNYATAIDVGYEDFGV